jgi:formate dehydrogenase maturation protein FdhE
MDAVTRSSTADPLAYTGARFRISKASMGRRSLFNTICADVRKNASPQESAVIEQLATGDRALAGKSAAHVMRWTADAIAADWHGYCQASRQIRKQMAIELDAEASLLFALLERRSCSHWGASPPRSKAA